MISLFISNVDGDEEKRLLDWEKKEKEGKQLELFFPLFKDWTFKLRPSTRKEKGGIKGTLSFALTFFFLRARRQDCLHLLWGKIIDKKENRAKKEGKKKGKRNGPCHTYLVKRGTMVAFISCAYCTYKTCILSL